MTPTPAPLPDVEVGATITINDHHYRVVRVETHITGRWADVAGPGGLAIPVPLDTIWPDPERTVSAQ